MQNELNPHMVVVMGSSSKDGRRRCQTKPEEQSAQLFWAEQVPPTGSERHCKIERTHGKPRDVIDCPTIHLLAASREHQKPVT